MSELGLHREASGSDAIPVLERPWGRRRSDRVVGAGRATQEMVEQALAAARGDRPVLLWGPPGAGKHHLARAIHAWSARASGPFVVVSCATLLDGHAGREIFGVAPSPSRPDDPPGALSRAAGGTLLLQRLDRLPGPVQQSLSRALGEGRFVREGESSTVALRARLIATSIGEPERSPWGDVPQHVIRVPSLAERSEDVLPLAAHFLRVHADELGLKPVGFTADARQALVSERWEGNARELAERVRQAVKLAGGGVVSAEALLLSADSDEVPSFKEAKRAFETRYVTGLLRRCRGNISRAARLAKKDRKDFYDVIRRTGIDPTQFR